MSTFCYMRKLRTWITALAVAAGLLTAAGGTSAVAADTWARQARPMVTWAAPASHGTVRPAGVTWGK